jgi:hypothetical protein
MARNRKLEAISKYRMAKEGITPRAKDNAHWYLDIVRGALCRCDTRLHRLSVFRRLPVFAPAFNNEV